jgi:ferric-dicitrate binding protein FerR (iron transport regulator)
MMVRGFVFSVEDFPELFETGGRRGWSYRVKRRRQGRTRRKRMNSASAGAAMGLFLFLAVGAVALFSMVSVAVWSEARRKEREAYYKNDMLKKLADTPGPGATSALELLREEARLGALRKRQGLRIGGLVMMAIGIGVMILLKALVTDEPVYLAGLLVLLIGVALYGSSYLVTTGLE